MPGQTPNFGIRFPCYGDAVNDTYYQNFANDVDGALTTINTLRQAVQRPATVKTAKTAQNITVNTDTNINFAGVDWDNAAWWSAGTPANLTIPTSGIYYVSAKVAVVFGFTTCTSVRITMLLAATPSLPDNKINQTGAVNCFGLFSATAGQVVNMRVRWTGTGGPATFAGMECVLYKVCNI
jgi:hypothetical protein